MRGAVLVVGPSVAVLRFRVLDEVENLNVALPGDFAAKDLCHWYGREVTRPATVGGEDRLFKRGDVFRVRRH